MAIDSQSFAHAAASSKQRYLIARSGVEFEARKRNLRRFRIPLMQKIKLHKKWFFLSTAGLGIAAIIGVRGGYLVQESLGVTAPITTAAKTAALPSLPIVLESTKTPPIPTKEEVLIKVEQIKVSPTKQPQQAVASKGVTKALPTSSVNPNPVLIKPVAEVKTDIKPLDSLQRAKDSKDTNELGFKVSAGYTVVGIPADGVVLIKKDGGAMQQMIKVGGRFPDGEELRSASSATKQIETNARKYSQP
jgi:hypothetical protein